MGDATQIAIWTGAICGGIGTLIGALAAAWVVIKRAGSEMSLADRKQKREAQEKVIEQLTARVDALESKLDKKEDDHRECERKLGLMEGRIQQLSEEMNKALQRHDTKSFEQILAMKDETIKEMGRQLAVIEANKTPPDGND